MKYIAIYVSSINPATGPRFKAPVYEKAYPQLFSLINKYGGTPILVHEQSKTYKGRGVFSEYWIPIFNKKEELVRYEHKIKDIKVSFVYDKARFESDDIQVLNSNTVRDVCKDKYLSYLLVPELHPTSFLVTDNKQLDTFIASKGDEKFVLKELDSNGGRAVFIGTANKYTNNLSYPLIAQEFTETLGGYGDMVGRHDVRIVLFDGQVIQGRLRTPPAGELIANTSYGGHNQVLEPTDIPSDVVRLAKYIDHKIQALPGSEHRYFSADFGYDGKDWKLFELNAWPGLVDCTAGKAEQESMSKLAICLIKCLD